MKLGVVRALVVAALLVTCGGAAQAQDVTISFKGTVAEANGSPFPDVAVGTPFTGYFTYNLAAPDQNSLPQVGDYYHASAPYGVTVAIGNRTFKSNPSNVNFLVELVNDYYNLDNFVFHSYNNLSANGVPIQYISFQLDDPTQTALSDTSLPATALNLSQWQQWVGLSISGLTSDPTYATPSPSGACWNRCSLASTCTFPLLRIRGLRDLQVLRAPRDRWGRRDRRDRKVLRDRPARQAPRDRKASPVRRVKG